MKQLISAMFDDYQAATKAVQRLKSSGIPSDYISIVGGNQEMRSDSAPLSTDHEGSAAGTGAATGAVVGGGAGLLAGLGLLAIPGLGPVVAAGWLASTLAGAAVGTAAGGLIGGLTEWGMSEEEAHGYAEGVRRGGTLVTARVDDALVDTAVQILDADGTVDMNERTEGWRREGWQGTLGMGDRPAGTDSLAGSAGGRPVTESQPRRMPQVNGMLNRIKHTRDDISPIPTSGDDANRVSRKTLTKSTFKLFPINAIEAPRGNYGAKRQLSCSLGEPVRTQHDRTYPAIDPSPASP